MYLKAPVADTEERDLGLARARFHLGGCLLKTGMAEDGLAETEAGLELAADSVDPFGFGAQQSPRLRTVDIEASRNRCCDRGHSGLIDRQTRR